VQTGADIHNTHLLPGSSAHIHTGASPENRVMNVRTGWTILFTAATALTCIAAAPAAIDWQTDYNAALALAVEQNKPLMVYFGGDWCPWCDKMRDEVHTDAAVIETLSAFVSVTLVAEDNSELAQRLGFDGGIPATAFIMPDETVLQLVVGYRAAPLFDVIAKQAIATVPKLDGLKVLWQAYTDQTATLAQAAELLTFCNRSDQSARARQLVEYIDERITEELAPPESYLLDRPIALLNADSEAPPLDQFKTWVESHDSEHARYYEALYWYGLAVAYSRDLDGAEATWKAVTEKVPDTIWGKYAQLYLDLVAQIRGGQPE
jgi:thiol-disulfide isomerase/thioredoxin